MATGRTHIRFARAYVDGYDMSGYTRTFGPLACTFEEGTTETLTDTVKGVMTGSATIGAGTLNGLFDNTATSGLHIVMKGAGVTRNVMFPIGIQAAPADNDPVFAYQFLQLDYTGNADSNPVAAGITFGNASATGAVSYAKPWGVLLHAKAARTAASTATGLDQTASSALGGFMQYQVFAGNGTATIKVQHANANVDGSFADLLSSGVIDCTTPSADIVALAHSATVERYVRWQIALGTATTVTFAISFHRNNL